MPAATTLRPPHRLRVAFHAVALPFYFAEAWRSWSLLWGALAICALYDVLDWVEWLVRGDR